MNLTGFLTTFAALLGETGNNVWWPTHAHCTDLATCSATWSQGGVRGQDSGLLRCSTFKMSLQLPGRTVTRVRCTTGHGGIASSQRSRHKQQTMVCSILSIQIRKKLIVITHKDQEDQWYNYYHYSQFVRVPPPPLSPPLQLWVDQ